MVSQTQLVFICSIAAILTVDKVQIIFEIVVLVSSLLTLNIFDTLF